MNERSKAGTGGFVKPKKPVVTLKIELPPMTTASALRRAQEIADAIKEDEATRLKAISVTS